MERTRPCAESSGPSGRRHLARNMQPSAAMYTDSELSVAGFGRFIAGLASVHAASTLIVNLRPAALS